MEKYIDEKFFRFMGMEIKEYDEQIKRIEALCEVDAIEKYGEEELRQKLINHLLVSEYTKEDYEFSLGEQIIDYISDASAYEVDVNIAIFLLVGSYYSDWNNGGVCKGLPFLVYKDESKQQRVSQWCNAFVNTFNREEWHFMLNKIDRKTRVEKYSYLSMLKKRKILEECIEKDLGDEDKKRYMSAVGIENLLLFDRIFGVSFAEICYVYFKKVQKENQYYFEEIISILAKLKSSNIRNKLADGILSSVAKDQVKEEELKQLIRCLKKIVPMVNMVYSASLYSKWLPIQRNEITDKEQLWREVIKENRYDVYVLSNEKCAKEVYEEICDARGITELPSVALQDDDNRKSGIQMLEELQSLFGYIEKRGVGIKDEDIMRMNKERSAKIEMRGSVKNPKTVEEIYVHLQGLIIESLGVGIVPVEN